MNWEAERLINFVTSCWFAAVGGCLGSFINVVVYRLPKGLSLVWLPSKCPRCQHPIRARHNLPVVGWLMLRGRCYDCGEPIAARYAFVEAAMAAGFVMLAYGELYSGGANLPLGPLTRSDDALDLMRRPCWPLIAIFAGHCLWLSVLTAMALFDLDRRLIPPQVAAMAGLVCLTLIGALAPQYTSGSILLSSTDAAQQARWDGLLGSCCGLPGFVAGFWILRTGRIPGRLLNRSLAVTSIGAVLGLAGGVASVVLLGLAWSLASFLSSEPSHRRDRWTLPATVVAALALLVTWRQWLSLLVEVAA